MNEEQFKEFAERIASEDETRIALRSAFQWNGHSIVSDGRVALVVDKAFESLPVAADSQETIGRSLYNDILPRQSKDEYAEFNLDVDLLGRAATATAQDLASEMETLRHYVADPDDPDDMDSYDSERYVLERHTYVIMPDPRRSVIAGYYASVIADICKGRAVRAYASQKTSNMTLYVKGDTWQLAIMPILMDGKRRNAYCNEIRSTAVADAKTGELVWHRKEDDACPIDTLRFPEGKRRSGGSTRRRTGGSMREAKKTTCHEHPTTKLKKISAQDAERRTCYVRDFTSEFGRSKAIVECPFCGKRNIVYKWSLAGSGKRCLNESCRAHLCWGVAIKDMVPTESEVEA